MRVLPWAIAVLGVMTWRSGRVIKDIIVVKTSFPSAWFSKGNFSTQCRTLGGVVDDHAPLLRYCEDATFWDLLDRNGNLNERRVIMSCDPGKRELESATDALRDFVPPGSLWMYTTGSTSSPPVHITFEGYPAGHEFHPLGVEVWPSFDGNSSNLYVINLARPRSVVEQFLLSPSETRAKHIRTLSSPYFVAPNALALTSPTSFYVTNDHLTTPRLPKPFGFVLPIVETIFGLPLGWVGHVDVIEKSSTSELVYTFALWGIAMPNGISLSNDGSQLAVASSSLAQIYFYSRSPSSGILTYNHSVPVPFAPDNIVFTTSNALIVTGVAHFPSLLAVAASPPGPETEVSPSWVVSLTSRPNSSNPSQVYDVAAPVSVSSKVRAVAGYDVETLFQSNGTGFSSSTGGLLDETTGELYVAGVFAEEGVLVCKSA